MATLTIATSYAAVPYTGVMNYYQRYIFYWPSIIWVPAYNVIKSSNYRWG